MATVYRFKIGCDVSDILQRFALIHMNDEIDDYQDAWDQFLEDNSELKLKETISISPGGLQGFYLIGIVDFLKHNYNLDSYLLTGASAGAWSCLLMSYKGDTKKFIKS